jgi:hypothetical protein
VSSHDLAGVIWHRHGHTIEIFYVEGEPDQLVGTEAVAEAFARDAGLRRLPTPRDKACWVW